MKMNDDLKISFSVTNTGALAGEEIVQFYIRDQVASLVRPLKELKDFKKVSLQPGESRRIEFLINKEKLSFYNAQLKWIAEQGRYDIMIGSASDDIRLASYIDLIK